MPASVLDNQRDIGAARARARRSPAVVVRFASSAAGPPAAGVRGTGALPGATDAVRVRWWRMGDLLCLL
jgi:hypothetical protein